jgi:hypothetical protein
MELADLSGSSRSGGGLALAAITRVYTLAHVAEMLSEDIDWLSEIAGEMEPEDGYLWIYGPNEEQTEGFTDFGIDNLINVIREYQFNPELQPRPPART